MSSAALTVWCNFQFPEPAVALLNKRLAGHRIIFPSGRQQSNLVAAGPDPLLAEADVAFGQPDVGQTMQLSRLRWVELTTAGYTRYDRDDLRAALAKRGAVMTNTSGVYAEPCAEHVFSMMMALARQLPQCMAEQLSTRAWRAYEHRLNCRLLLGQSVLILGYGAIARRLTELLAPFQMSVIATRRKVSSSPLCKIVTTDKTDDYLPSADHIVNILPANAQTTNFLDRRRLGLLKPSAIVYNIGRGATVDQTALAEALQAGRLAASYLDVTDPEPLPTEHPLWTAPNSYITPHTAGGHDTEFLRLVEHFADNLDRFVAGKELVDRIA